MIKVFITKYGNKYHDQNCSFAVCSSEILDVVDAIALGYEPCKICKVGQQKANENNDFDTGNYCVECGDEITKGMKALVKDEFLINKHPLDRAGLQTPNDCLLMCVGGKFYEIKVEEVR